MTYTIEAHKKRRVVKLKSLFNNIFSNMKDIKDTDKDTEQIFVFLGAALYLFHEVVPSQAHTSHI